MRIDIRHVVWFNTLMPKNTISKEGYAALGVRTRDMVIVSPPKVAPVVPQAPADVSDRQPSMIVMDAGARPVGVIDVAKLNTSEQQTANVVARLRRHLSSKP
jgi:hypothetical protein